MSKELKVTYEEIKSKYKIIPLEMAVENDKIKYKRAKKKAEDRKLTKDYIGKKEEYDR